MTDLSRYYEESYPPTLWAAPTGLSMAPTTAEVGAADLLLVVSGEGLSPRGVIYFNGSAEVTDYQEGNLTTWVQPSSASGAATVPVEVSQNGTRYDVGDFTFTDTLPMAEPEAQEP